MKKYIIFSAAVMAVFSVKAQLIVDSIGNVGIGDSPAPYYKTSIYSLNNGGLNLNTGTIDGTNAIGLLSDAQLAAGGSVAYGVMASAGGASLANVGLGGTVLHKGAAVYGRTSSSVPIFTEAFAGYFQGNVCVTGNLQVSGGITGGLLTPSIPSSNGASSMAVEDVESTNGVGQLFSGLKAKTFYYDAEKMVTKGIRMDGKTDLNHPVIEDLPFSEMEKQTLAKQHYSLSTEDVEKIFPDLVYENEDGTKSINYVEMVPILAQVMGELSAKVQALEKDKGEVMMAKQIVTGIDKATEDLQVLSMGQNRPNPFSVATEVEVVIPEYVQSAYIYVYDLTGKKVQSVDITVRGKQTVQLNSTSLEEGMYLYSLIADGKVIQTRRMIIDKKI